MKTLKYILLLLLILIIGFSIYIAVQPNEYKFNRSRTINAPVELLYNKVNDYKAWPSFSPWIELEPEATITYGEKTIGNGGSYGWNGEILGEGSMTTLSTEPNKSIAQKINFIKPFEAESDINWTFEKTPEGTKVTWAMEGKQDFMTKLFTTLTGSIESETGPSFERGLFKLDSITTAEMKRYDIKIDGITEYGGGFYLYKTTNANSQNISAKMGENFGALLQFMGKNGIKQNGMPLTVYNTMNSNDFIMSNGIPVKERIDLPADSDVSINFIPKIKVVKTTLKGNYTNLPKAWKAAKKYLAENNLEQSEEKPFEIYTTDPGNYPNPADWITEIYFPIK